MNPSAVELGEQIAKLNPLLLWVVVIALLGFMWANLLNEQRATKGQVKRALRAIARLSRKVRRLELELGRPVEGE